MSGFTKGPWMVGKGYGMHGAEVVGNEGNRMVCGVIGVDKDQYDKEGRKIATVRSEEGWANARLIASSPELYEALVKAEELLSFHEGSAKPEFDGAHPTVRINGEDFAILLADIRAALSKAAGKGA